MATDERPAAQSELGRLFGAASPPEVHTSGWALTSFLIGFGALLAAPFSVMFGFAFCLGLLGVLLALAGVAATSHPYVAGGALPPLALSFSLVALALVGLRYLNVDTAFGDLLQPTLHEVFERLNARMGAR